MKIYKNPWVTRESYFVKTGTAKSAKMEASKSSGYSIALRDTDCWGEKFWKRDRFDLCKDCMTKLESFLYGGADK